MNFELCKKLKDAGFPQVWPKPDFLELHDAIAISEIMAKYDSEVYVPTLPELIKACGEKFTSLHRGDELDELLAGKDAVAKWPWCAVGMVFTKEDADYTEVGATPEEAVAKLWLALNENGRHT